MGKTAMGPAWANPLGARVGFLWASPLWACPQKAHMGAQMSKTAMGPAWANPLGALVGFLWANPQWACPQKGPQRVCPCPHCPTENPHLPTVGPHWHVCWVPDTYSIRNNLVISWLTGNGTATSRARNFITILSDCISMKYFICFNCLFSIPYCTFEIRSFYSSKVIILDMFVNVAWLWLFNGRAREPSSRPQTLRRRWVAMETARHRPAQWLQLTKRQNSVSRCCFHCFQVSLVSKITQIIHTTVLDTSRTCNWHASVEYLLYRNGLVSQGKVR